MSAGNILVVDDHEDIRELLATYLTQHGYTVMTASGGVPMREHLQRHLFDLILLDVMMPGEDGLSLCQFVRREQGPPVIMLTAMDDDADCIVGLEMGADDYITKPFVPRVLLARVKALLRRSQQHNDKDATLPDSLRVFDRWSLDSLQRQLTRDDGLVVPLSTAEFKLLDVFLQNPQRVLSRDELLNMTKGRDADPFDRSVDNQVSRLRKKIEQDPQQPRLIKTVWGGGYMLSASVAGEAR